MVFPVLRMVNVLPGRYASRGICRVYTSRGIPPYPALGIPCIPPSTLSTMTRVSGVRHCQMAGPWALAPQRPWVEGLEASFSSWFC